MATKKAPANVKTLTGAANTCPVQKAGDAAHSLAHKVWASLIAIYGAEHGAALIVREKEAAKVG